MKIKFFLMIFALSLQQPLFAAETQNATLDQDPLAEYCLGIAYLAETSMQLHQDNQSLEYSKNYFQENFIKQADIDKKSADFQLFENVVYSIINMAYTLPVEKTAEEKTKIVEAFKAEMLESCKKNMANLS